MEVSTSFLVVFISQCKHVLKHSLVHLTQTVNIYTVDICQLHLSKAGVKSCDKK